MKKWRVSIAEVHVSLRIVCGDDINTAEKAIERALEEGIDGEVSCDFSHVMSGENHEAEEVTGESR